MDVVQIEKYKRLALNTKGALYISLIVSAAIYLFIFDDNYQEYSDYINQFWNLTNANVIFCNLSYLIAKAHRNSLFYIIASAYILIAIQDCETMLIAYKKLKCSVLDPYINSFQNHFLETIKATLKFS